MASPANRVTSRNSSIDKRAAILRAATRVFARNGYFNSKVADIARAADVADGTVYLYFKSKEEILHSIFDQNMAEAIAAARKLIKEVTDPREKLRRIASLHLERLGADRDLAVVFQVELRGSTKFMEEFSAAGFAEYLGLLHDIFEEGQRAGVFRKDLNATIGAKILFGALDEMATNWIISHRNYKLAPMADVVMDVFLNGVRVGWCKNPDGRGGQHNSTETVAKTDYIDFQARTQPLVFLITFRSYGTWLHGEKRGSVDRRRYNRYGTPGMPANEKILKEKQLELHRPVRLTKRQRGIVTAAIEEVCKQRQYCLYALNVRTNHVHAVVNASRKPEHIMNGFKSYSTRKLREANLLAQDVKPWAGHGSTPYLWTEEQLRNAIDYVLYGQGDEPFR